MAGRHGVNVVDNVATPISGESKLVTVLLIVVRPLLMNINYVNLMDAVIGPLLMVPGAAVPLLVELGYSGVIIIIALVEMHPIA
jgi:hypothetical protein